MARKKPAEKGGCLFLTLIILVVSLGWTGHWIWAGLAVVVLVFAGWMLSPASPESYVRKAMENFLLWDHPQWQELERDFKKRYPTHVAGHLIYAMRVASVLPTLTQVPTLASRWNTAHCGAGESGLDAARMHSMHREVRDFLEGHFRQALQGMLDQHQDKIRQRVVKAKTATVRNKLVAGAEENLLSWEPLFSHAPPEFGYCFEKARQQIPGGI